MKRLNLKSKMLLVALLLGAGAAGANHLANLPAADETKYNWSRSAGSPQPGEENPLLEATVREAEINYGCEGEGALCAQGVNPDNPMQTAEIKFN